ncbi:hypothetical protein ZHAS_00003900 [Anopheles sinensis]|uniref:Uncharacterized protein n=1 Tax=Anopheles sinensis TaxID=74873 RepID=A0A084VFJ4_ANOSI|nr:hypothetical protein ZHAS_00003900 [Anopheles sinensis]
MKWVQTSNANPSYLSPLQNAIRTAHDTPVPGFYNRTSISENGVGYDRFQAVLLSSHTVGNFIVHWPKKWSSVVVGSGSLHTPRWRNGPGPEAGTPNLTLKHTVETLTGHSRGWHGDGENCISPAEYYPLDDGNGRKRKRHIQ